MHPQYIRAPSKNLAPHLWRLHHLKKNNNKWRGRARRGAKARRGRAAGPRRWVDPEPPGGRGVSGPPRAIAQRPRPAFFGDGSREHLRASPREAPPPLRAAPRRAPFWQGAVSAEAARGRHRARERGAASLLPPAPPRPRPPLPAPARPPARRAGADALNASRCGGGARRGPEPEWSGGATREALAARRRGASPGTDTPPGAGPRPADPHPPEAPRGSLASLGGATATPARPGRGIPGTRNTMCPTPGLFHIDRTKQQNEP